MVLTLEISKHARSEMVKNGCDVFIAEPAPIYIEKLASFSEAIGVSYRYKTEKIAIDSGVLFDVKGWKIIRDGERIPLPEKEFKLFYLFATNKDKIFTTEELLTSVWDERTEKDRVRHYIKKLRMKIGDNCQDPRLLIYENRAGYYLKNVM